MCVGGKRSRKLRNRVVCAPRLHKPMILSHTHTRRDARTHTHAHRHTVMTAVDRLYLSTVNGNRMPAPLTDPLGCSRRSAAFFRIRHLSAATRAESITPIACSWRKLGENQGVHRQAGRPSHRNHAYHALELSIELSIELLKRKWRVFIRAFVVLRRARGGTSALR